MDTWQRTWNHHLALLSPPDPVPRDDQSHLQFGVYFYIAFSELCIRIHVAMENSSTTGKVFLSSSSPPFPPSPSSFFCFLTQMVLYWTLLFHSTSFYVSIWFYLILSPGGNLSQWGCIMVLCTQALSDGHLSCSYLVSFLSFSVLAWTTKKWVSLFIFF